MRVIILGGNAAGMSAAGRLKRRAPDTEVIVFEQSGEVSYGACGLPYYVGGVTDDLDLLRIRKPEVFRAQGIDLRLMQTAEGVDFKGQIVRVRHADGRLATERYDRLVIATGSSPIKPRIPGTELDGVSVLKTLAEGEALKEALVKAGKERVVIAGGGYIGLELAEACIRLKKQVHIFEALPRLLNGFDEAFATAAAEELTQNGVALRMSEAIERVEQGENCLLVHTPLGVYEADAVVFAIGVRPNTAFLEDERLQKLLNGAIAVDARMETSIPGVYAAGDCASVLHKLSKKPVYIPLGTNANKQGRFAADAMLGNPAAGYTGTLGTAMLRCVTLEFAKTGLTEAEAAAAGLDAAAVTVKAASHAPYYTEPAPTPVTIRVCYEKGSGRLLGAQIMGRGESAWRINVFACAINQGMRAEELGALDMGYAPPFSTAWDVVQIAANAVKV